MEVLMVCVAGGKYLHKWPKIFLGQVWENSGKNPSHPQKFACSYTYVYIPSYL